MSQFFRSVVLIGLLNACGSNHNGAANNNNNMSGGSTAQVKVAFTQQAASASFWRSLPERAKSLLLSKAFADPVGPTSLTPEYFGMKLVAIYITPDIDMNQNNVGLDGGPARTQAIWAAPVCRVQSGGNEQGINFGACDIELGESGSSSGMPITLLVDTFFDFAASDVNTQLNSQHLPITAGLYKYIRISFAGAAGGMAGGGTAKTIKFWHADMGGANADDGVLSGKNQLRKIDVKNVALGSEGMNIEAGRTLTLSLSYSLTDAIQVYDAASIGITGDCTEDIGGKIYCINIPTFTPTLVVE